MTKQQLEYLVLQAADRIRNGQPHEDQLVELKRDWPDPADAARQLAAIANAALGEPVVWIVGLHRTDGIVGAADQELANWWPAVVRRFDEGVAPELAPNFNVPVSIQEPDGSEWTVTVVALQFETDRAPYVVTCSTGQVHREVPWRSATGIRRAGSWARRSRSSYAR
jgi:hypothetical protein